MAKRWYKPVQTNTGWNKHDPAVKRRNKMLKAQKGDYLAAGRAMQGLANVTKDKTTRNLAQADANYFFRENQKRKRK